MLDIQGIVVRFLSLLQNVQTGIGPTQATTNTGGSLPGISGRGVRLPNYTNLVPRLRITGATPPLNLILHGVRRDNFNLTTLTIFFNQFNL